MKYVLMSTLSRACSLEEHKFGNTHAKNRASTLSQYKGKTHLFRENTVGRIKSRAYFNAKQTDEQTEERIRDDVRARKVRGGTRSRGIKRTLGG